MTKGTEHWTASVLYHIRIPSIAYPEAYIGGTVREEPYLDLQYIRCLPPFLIPSWNASPPAMNPTTRHSQISSLAALVLHSPPHPVSKHQGMHAFQAPCLFFPVVSWLPDRRIYLVMFTKSGNHDFSACFRAWNIPLRPQTISCRTSLPSHRVIDSIGN